MGLGPREDEAPLQVARLGIDLVPVSTDCWRGAYNTGTGYWVARDTAPYRVEMVTWTRSNMRTDGSVLWQKGRGPGDCISTAEWAWGWQPVRADIRIHDRGVRGHHRRWPLVAAHARGQRGRRLAGNPDRAIALRPVMRARPPAGWRRRRGSRRLRGGRPGRCGGGAVPVHPPKWIAASGSRRSGWRRLSFRWRSPTTRHSSTSKRPSNNGSGNPCPRARRRAAPRRGNGRIPAGAARRR